LRTQAINWLGIHELILNWPSGALTFSDSKLFMTWR